MTSEPMFAFGACDPTIYLNDGVQITTTYSITAQAHGWRDGTTVNNTFIAYRNFSGTATTSGTLYGVALEPSTVDLAECLTSYRGEHVSGVLPSFVDGCDMIGMIRKYNGATITGGVVAGGTYHSFIASKTFRWRLNAANGVAVCMFAQVVQSTTYNIKRRNYILSDASGNENAFLLAPNPVASGGLMLDWGDIQYDFLIEWNKCANSGIIATVCNGVEYV